MSEFFRALQRAERERALRQPSTDDSRDRAAAAPAGEAPRATVTPAPPEPKATATPEREERAPRATSGSTEAPPVITTGRAAAVIEAPESAPRFDAQPLSALLASRVDPTSEEMDERLVSLMTPAAFEADQYRVLRHTIEQRRRTTGLAVVAVSSAGPGDGKTTTAINLAGALAQDPAARVLLVDCDLRSSALGRRLGLGAGRGLVQAIVDPVLTLDDVVQHLSHFNLDVLTAGFETFSPYELLKSPRLGELFAAARRRFDYVVVDTPPVVPFPDCRVLAKVVDGFLLVVFTHRTPRRIVDEALGTLPKESVLGVVANGEDQFSRATHAYYSTERDADGHTWGSSVRRAWTRAWRAGRARGRGESLKDAA